MVDPQPASVYRRRRIAVTLAAVAGVVLLGVVAARIGADDGEPPARPSAASAPPRPDRQTTTTRVAPKTTTTTPTGRFTRAGGSSAVVGRGTPHRYAVEVEVGSGVDVDTFARAVDVILADRRGWTTADGLSLQRVSDDSAMFTVRLATPDTTDRLCAPLTTEGEASCGHNLMAVINLRRWRQGAEPSKLDLADYRRYVVTHEFGHLLGHRHVPCPGPGSRAPVMMQQTYGIGPCAPNPWPAPDA